MTVVIMLAVAIADLAVGICLGLWARKVPRPQNIDYKERWEAAVKLLGDTDRLTKEEVQQITEPAARPSQPADSLQPQPSSQPIDNSPPVPPATATLRSLHRMASWDRKDIEIERAKAGLPPVDDLFGMTSWDVRDVLKARARYRTG